MVPKFTSKEVRTFEGGEALKRLQGVNDLKFLTKQGITAVDESRWKDAQYYEHKTWMEVNLCRNHDHNEQNKSDLGGYSYLAGKSFGKVIELGCGPFTNLVCILPLIDAPEVYLLDPLIKSYLYHPNCKYSNGRLSDHPVTMFASSIEDFQTSLKFDLVVMINVLQHCREANKVLDTLWSILSPGGILVFHEPSFKIEQVENFYDAGHPLLVTNEYIEDFLKKFKTVYRNEIKKVPDEVFDRYICFAGIKEST